MTAQRSVESGLSPLAQEVRRFDADRFFTALFAPAEHREDVLTLYAFNSEIARIRETVTETTLGAIRLQWWRETLTEIYNSEKFSPPHPTAQALAMVIRRHNLPAALFEELLEARTCDMDERPIPDQESLAAYIQCTGGHLARLAALVLGAGEDGAEAAGKVGAAYALSGLLRAVPFHTRQGRFYLPADLLADHGTQESDFFSDLTQPQARAAVAELRNAALTALAEARDLWKKVPQRRPAVAAVLPGTLAEGYLQRLKACEHNPYHPRLGLPQRRPMVMAWRAWRGAF